MEMTARVVQQGGVGRKEHCQHLFQLWHGQSCRSAPGDPARLFSCLFFLGISHCHTLRMWISDFLSLSLALSLPLYLISVIVPLIYLPLFHSVPWLWAGFTSLPAFLFLLSIWFLCSSLSSTLIPFLLCLELCLLPPLVFRPTRPAPLSAPSTHPGFQPHASPSLPTPAVAKPGAVLGGKVAAAIAEPTL